MNTFATASSSRALFGGIGCVALTAMLVAIGAGQIRGREAAGGQDFTLEVPDASLFPTQEGQDDIPMPSPSGEDMPAGDTTGPQPSGLEQGREASGIGTADDAAPPPPAPEGQAAPPTPRFNAEAVTVAAAPVSFARPIVLAAGRFSLAGKVLELEGIVPVPVNRQCQDSAGEGWPCGRMARTAFANLVRGRTIDCAVPEREWSGTATARCTVAGKDLSLWLAENGWTDVVSDSPFETAAEAARQAGLGLHSPNPRGKASRANGGRATGSPAGASTPQQP